MRLAGVWAGTLLRDVIGTELLPGWLHFFKGFGVQRFEL